MKSGGPPDPWRGLRMDYLHPDGRPAMTTLGASLTLLPQGFSTRPYRSTDNLVASLVEGRIEVEAGDEAFVLEPGDIMAIPGWTPYRFSAPQESVLFAFSDQPAYVALGLLRERREEAGAA